jgi:hypothetical protein
VEFTVPEIASRIRPPATQAARRAGAVCFDVTQLRRVQWNDSVSPREDARAGSCISPHALTGLWRAPLEGHLGHQDHSVRSTAVVMDIDKRSQSVWIGTFRRKSDLRTGPLRAWHDWDDGTQSEILSQIALESGELPVLLSKPREPEQMLMTTRRLLHGSSAVRIADIVDVKPIDAPTKRKNQLDELEVGVALAGPLKLSSISPGPAYFALWSVLLNIARRNKHRSAEDFGLASGFASSG